MPVEDVAARFGVAVTHVQRRLKLARVSPRLRKLYVAGELSLEQLMAFTVSDDHAAQERVWKDLPQWSRDADDIRAGLTREALRFDNSLVRFVGVEAYTAAGGGILRDLFDRGNEGYLTDRVLLLRLAGERLDAAVAGNGSRGRSSGIMVCPMGGSIPWRPRTAVSLPTLPRTWRTLARLCGLAGMAGWRCRAGWCIPTIPKGKSTSPRPFRPGARRNPATCLQCWSRS
jgi:hypothetical protein